MAAKVSTRQLHQLGSTYVFQSLKASALPVAGILATLYDSPSLNCRWTLDPSTDLQQKRARGVNHVPTLEPISTQRTFEEAIAFRWRCSACHREFSLPQIPNNLSVTGSRYRAGVDAVHRDFAKHCTRLHLAGLQRDNG